MSFYVISGFEAMESLLKKLENIPDNSGKGTVPSTTKSVIAETVEKKAFLDSTFFIFYFGV